jgi:TIR domain
MAPESHQPTPYVFLSYASADRDRALQIADLVEARGVSVWIDRKSIAGGTSWAAEIVEGIKGCAVLISEASSRFQKMAPTLFTRMSKRSCRARNSAAKPQAPLWVARSPARHSTAISARYPHRQGSSDLLV